MNIKELETLIENTLSPNTKKIYENHLAILKNELANCESCKKVEQEVVKVKKEVKKVVEEVEAIVINIIEPTPTPEVDKEDNVI